MTKFDVAEIFLLAQFVVPPELVHFADGISELKLEISNCLPQPARKININIGNIENKIFIINHPIQDCS
jgi:hypothetical protein